MDTSDRTFPRIPDYLDFLTPPRSPITEKERELYRELGARMRTINCTVVHATAPPHPTRLEEADLIISLDHSAGEVHKTLTVSPAKKHWHTPSYQTKKD